MGPLAAAGVPQSIQNLYGFRPDVGRRSVLWEGKTDRRALEHRLHLRKRHLGFRQTRGNGRFERFHPWEPGLFRPSPAVPETLGVGASCVLVPPTRSVHACSPSLSRGSQGRSSAVRGGRGSCEPDEPWSPRDSTSIYWRGPRDMRPKALNSQAKRPNCGLSRGPAEGGPTRLQRLKEPSQLATGTGETPPRARSERGP
jgi:hypothetical protein